MNSSESSSRSPGQPLRTSGDCTAFVPAPLPPSFEWNTGLVSALSKADQALGMLTGIGRKLPNPTRLVRMFLRREAEYSSRIEQTHARLQTMLLFEELPKVEEDAPDVREVANNFRVLEFAFEATARWPITVAMIRRMHEILWKGVERRHLTPGRFRTVQNFIGRTRNIQDARYVPPPPQEVEPCMRELVGFMQKPGNLPALVRCALVHYQFEAIHPFVDGNGRIGRALMLLMLKNEDLLPVPLLNPSAQLERNRREYYDLLLDVSRVGAWEAWLEFFAVCVADEAKDACERLTKLENLRDGYRRKFSAARTSALLMRLIDDLFADPAISAPRTAKALRVSAPNAQRLVDKLVKARVLREVTGKRRNRVYIAQEIVDLFSSRS